MLEAMQRALDLRITCAGGVYDLFVTLPFATPWTARILLSALDSLPLGGPPMPRFEEGHLLFVVLFGTIVSLWSLLRSLAPRRELLLVDTAGRLLFALWMLRALMLGAPHATALFAGLEILWAFVQGFALWRSRKRPQ